MEYLNGPGIDKKIRQKGSSTSTTYYFSQDHLGSTTALTGTTGKLVERQTYDAYGNSAGSTRTRYGYTGRERDPLTSLLYYRARWYDPLGGRFISEDPIGFRGGDVNLYGYVWQNPLSFTDPRGLDGWGNDTADWLDKRIESGRRYFQPNPDAVNWNTAINYAANVYHGAADLFRVGSGLGDAIFDPNDNNYGRGANIALDISRAAAIFQLLGGPAAGVTGGLRATQSRGAVPALCDVSVPTKPPKPPAWTQDWEWRYPEGLSPKSPRWFDPQGGEWRWHPADKWHPESHWDHNPWDNWNSPWRNVPHN